MLIRVCTIGEARVCTQRAVGSDHLRIVIFRAALTLPYSFCVS